MYASANDVSVRALPSEAAGACKVVIFFEDSPTRSTALRVCERLLEQFGEDLNLEFSWWKLGRLADSALACGATCAAAGADIVMFCTRGGALPPEAADWLESWAESGVRGSGVLTFVSTEVPSPSSEMTIARLGRAARLLGMDFIRLIPPEPAASTAGQNAFVAAFPPAYAPDLDRPYADHWGLNE